MLKELYLLWLRLAAPQDLHYINGADTLPPPLPPEQERAALDALTRGQPQARDLLITHNLRLVVYIAKKAPLLYTGGSILTLQTEGVFLCNVAGQ